MAKLKSPMISNVRHSMKVYKLYWTHGIGASHKDLYRKAMQREHFQCCIRHVQQRRTHPHSCRAFSVVLLNDGYLFSSYKFTVWIESHFYLCFFSRHYYYFYSEDCYCYYDHYSVSRQFFRMSFHHFSLHPYKWDVECFASFTLPCIATCS